MDTVFILFVSLFLLFFFLSSFFSFYFFFLSVLPVNDLYAKFFFSSFFLATTAWCRQEDGLCLDTKQRRAWSWLGKEGRCHALGPACTGCQSAERFLIQFLTGLIEPADPARPLPTPINLSRAKGSPEGAEEEGASRQGQTTPFVDQAAVLASRSARSLRGESSERRCTHKPLQGPRRRKKDRERV